MKVLVIKTSSLGDLVHTLPALNDACGQIPGIRFDWVAEENFAEIPDWHPAVDRVLPVAIRRWRKNLWQTFRNGEWRDFKRALQATRYDAVIDAQGLFKSAWITRKAQGPKFGLDRDSAREPIASRFYDHPKAVAKGQHAVERVRQLFAQSLGYRVPEGLGRFGLDRRSFADTDGLRPAKPYLVLLHGTTWPTKHWPEPYWCELAQALNREGFALCLPWGNPVERARAERIAAACEQAGAAAEDVRVLPRLNLSGIASVIAGATAVVAVDTGLGHLAAALEVPTVSLYGPTSPDLVGAYGVGQVHLSIRKLAPVTRVVEPAIFAPLTPERVMRALVPQLERGGALLRQLAAEQ